MSRTKGIEISEEKLHGHQVTTVRILSKEAAKELKKSISDYIIIEIGDKLNKSEKIEDIGECLAEALARILRPYYHGKLCICGIGNRDVPVDALGPEVLYNLPLKALSKIEAEKNFSDVCSFEPGTEWTNNIHTEVMVKGIVEEIEADCLLLVDSLLARGPSHLFRSIQVSTMGSLSPYLSGRLADWSALSIPVISIGVPMVISLPESSPGQVPELFTSTNVQEVIAAAGCVIAYAILRVC